MARPERTVAAFDFDGTLTRRDTLGPFLRDLVGSARLGRALAADLPRLAAVAAGRSSRDAAKERLLARLLAGFDADVVAARGESYGAWLAAERIRPLMRTRIDEHRRCGHELVLVSASLDVYLTEVARRLGFDAVLCTRLEVADGRLTGRLAGRNCRGAEKSRRLLAHLGGPPRVLWAYGDSRGDDALLALADRPVRVGRRTGALSPPDGPESTPRERRAG